MSEYEPGYEDDVVYEDAAPQSSIAAPLIRALLAAAVAFLIYGLVFGDLVGGGGDLELAQDPTAPAADAIPSAAPTPTSGAIPLEPGGAGTALPTEGATAGPAPTDGATDGAAGQVGQGVTMQVLAGADTTAEQVDAAIEALRGLGYEVTDTGQTSPNAYPTTTVFATPGSEADAQALVAADDRFTYDPEFPGLDESLQLHVFVGEDFPTT